MENPNLRELQESDIKDTFLEERLYVIRTHGPSWFSEFANYLAAGLLPTDLSYQQKKKFFADVKFYLWEEPFLYKVCADQVIRRCVPYEEMMSIMSHCHDKEVGGYFGVTRTA